MEFITKTKIEKGWSGDEKYCVTDTSGVKYLLRTSPIAQYERKKAEFSLMQCFASLDIPMCKAIEFGTDEDKVYSVQTWIDGCDAEEAVSKMTAQHKYSYGLEAGQILKKLHSIPAPDDAAPWETRFNSKLDRKLKMYADCSLKYDFGHVFIDFISENRHLLSNRPQVYQHGDYHIGNMMIARSGKLHIIDFNRFDYGDPWEEFNRIVWCAQAAPSFAKGMVDGYFDSNVPIEFWKLLALYISSNTLSSLPWAIPFGDGEITTMRNQATEVLDWYDGMKKVVPNWYTNAKG